MSGSSNTSTRHLHRIRRFPRLKALRLVLLALGTTSLVLGGALFVFGRRTGIARCQEYAYLYFVSGLLLLSVRWVLAWLKRRQKHAIRKRRREQDSPESSQAAS